MIAAARTICDHAREISYKSADARTIIKFAGDALKSYVVSFICDPNIICVPIFTMQTSVVVAQWLERSPCMLFVYDCFYCVFI